MNWTVSRLSVTEGDVVRLSGEVFGSYARPIEIGAVCAETVAVGVEKGMNINSRHCCLHDVDMSHRTTHCVWICFCLQPFLVKISTLQLELIFTSQMLIPLEVDLIKW